MDITSNQKEEILIQIKSAIEKNDLDKLSNISIKHKGDLAKEIAEIQKEMFEIGKKSAAVEL